jgi:hypothetical protein
MFGQKGSSEEHTEIDLYSCVDSVQKAIMLKGRYVVHCEVLREGLHYHDRPPVGDYWFSDRGRHVGGYVLVNGRVPAHTICPFREICEIKLTCNHLGLNHAIDYSCGVARGFEIALQASPNGETAIKLRKIIPINKK